MYKGMFWYRWFKYMINFSIELGTTKLFSTGVCNIDLAVLIYARSIQKWGSCCIEECNVQCPILPVFQWVSHFVLLMQKLKHHQCRCPNHMEKICNPWHIVFYSDLFRQSRFGFSVAASLLLWILVSLSLRFGACHEDNHQRTRGRGTYVRIQHHISIQSWRTQKLVLIVL